MADVSINLVVDASSSGQPEITYEEVYNKYYEPEASNYSGKAEVCTMQFTGLPEQIPLLTTVISTIEQAVAQKVADQNEGKLLQLRILRATGQWYNSYWKVEVTLHASPFPWAVVIPLIVVLLIVIGLSFISYQVNNMDWSGKALTGLGIGAGILLLVVMLLAFTGSKKSEKGVG